MANRIAASDVRLKRAYDPPAKGDGRRILVDRLWPRGVRKADAAIDQWIREIAPSADLRKWFNHDPERWPDFRRRYRAEIDARPELLAELRGLAREGPITLIYSARDQVHNDAVVLRNAILGRPGEA